MVERLEPDPHFSELIAKEWTPTSPLTRRAPRWPWALGTSALAATGVALLHGFTVDDAWISARVAAHIALGLGHRFNNSGPEVDAVTPLGWEYVLALFADGGQRAAWQAARVLGIIAWVAAAAYLGTLVADAGTRQRRFLVLPLLPFMAPLGAWAGAGMETGVVVALATLALGPHPAALAAAGLAAAWRPELLPWALVLGIGKSAARTDPRLWTRGGSSAGGRQLLASATIAVLLTLGPALGVALLRRAWFGDGPPLSWIAKPPSFEFGLRYAIGALCFSGAPALTLVGPQSLRRLDSTGWVLLLCGATHFVSLVLAGGDWMALYRLAAPVLPTFVLLGAKLADQSSWPGLGVRLLASLAGSLSLLIQWGPSARTVVEHRTRLIEAARPHLLGATRVAGLDIGWIGAATDADVLDLAGVTDPRIARLPGPHTNKQIPRSLLDSRPIDALVLLLQPGAVPAHPWWTSQFHYGVEARLAAFAEDKGFTPCSRLPLGGRNQEYLVLRKAPVDPTVCPNPPVARITEH